MTRFFGSHKRLAMNERMTENTLCLSGRYNILRYFHLAIDSDWTMVAVHSLPVLHFHDRHSETPLVDNGNAEKRLESVMTASLLFVV